MKRTILFAAALFGLALTSTAADPASHVNLFIGTAGHGHTFPGPVMPNGMIQPGPDTRVSGWDACGGYHYDDSRINGFSQTHLSGTGCASLGDFLLMPTTGEQTIAPQADSLQSLAFASAFSHATETAEPGYYGVTLERYDIRAEITATERAAIYRFTYPATAEAGMIIDADFSNNNQYLQNVTVEAEGDTAVRVSRTTHGWVNRREIYGRFVFSRAFRHRTVTDLLAPDAGGYRRPVVKMLLDFGPLAEGDTVMVKAAVSAVDADGARANIGEIDGWDFDAVRRKAREAWNHRLSAVKLEPDGGGDARDSALTVFYTALYHCFIHPSLFQDADGRYRGMDGEVRQGSFSNPIYHVYSLWDTHRGLHPLLSVIDPELNSRLLNSLLTKYDEGGILPMWELAGNYTCTMTGYHSASLLADAVTKGQSSFPASKAYRAARRSAEGDTAGIKAPGFIRRALMPPSKHFKNTLGWIPRDRENESVAKGLEYAYDDWCISLLAGAAGDRDGQRLFENRAGLYRNYFDPETRFMRGRDGHGAWHEPFNPRHSDHRSDDYCEGTAWQWSWFVPHDVHGLISLMGGREAFTARLDSLFTADSAIEGDGASSDISGMIGQYAHGNEPSHHIAHLYNYAGRPERTQKLVARILDGQYSDRPDGLSGNEDCGQMSAWYVLNALGIYQVAPGSPVYSLGRPWFPRAVVNLPSGRTLEIRTRGFTRDERAINRITLNGRELDGPFLSHNDIMGGGILEFEFML